MLEKNRGSLNNVETNNNPESDDKDVRKQIFIKGY